MDFWVWSFFGGIVATVVMDFASAQFRRFGISDALGGLLGRWVMEFKHLKFVIDGRVELETKETLKESRVGLIFHYLVGGGVVSLAYPAWFTFTGFDVPEVHVLSGLIFGVMSVSLTWFLQYPCFGFGLFGVNAPRGSSTILPPIILHSIFGLSLGLVLQVALIH